MQTNLSEASKALARADEAEAILRACVHCGFCNATCPTYQVLGNELDGPRGRIYLIKQLLEGEPCGERTQRHLDRCLTCRNCETTCPSGVRYHTLLDIGRAEAEKRAQRPTRERLLRAGLRHVVPRPATFAALLKAGRALRPAREAGCCGATEYHLNAQDAGLARARRNIDAWWPAIEAGAEAIVLTASGCGAFVKEYGDLLRSDPVYAEKARRVSALARDLAEVIAAEPLDALAESTPRRVAVHCPCTLQHAQRLGGAVESILTRLGFDLTNVADGHLCCGSAGTYSLTQPELATTLRDNKLDALEAARPDLIVTANVGCQTHLNGAGRTPVRHWIELVDNRLVN